MDAAPPVVQNIFSYGCVLNSIVQHFPLGGFGVVHVQRDINVLSPTETEQAYDFLQDPG